MLTRQEAFEQVSNHFITQGQQAKEGRYGCRYLTQNKMKCAIGFFIPDEKYNELLEGAGVCFLIESELIPFENTEANLYFLLNMQAIHDDPSAWHPDNMKNELQNSGVLHDLDVTFLDKLDFSKIKP